MIIPSPPQIKAALVAGAAMAIACLALLVWGLYWRGEYREAKAAVTVYAAQAAINKGAVERCSAGADEVAKLGRAATTAMGVLLAEARRANKDRDERARALDDLARRPRATGEDCSWAWRQIEEQHRAASKESNRKAGAAP